ncbi:putative fucosyltransferase 9 [Diplonema papillatum]|nr:putative fucosyltransferase 9 [Diplonema papillatum]
MKRPRSPLSARVLPGAVVLAVLGLYFWFVFKTLDAGGPAAAAAAGPAGGAGGRGQRLLHLADALDGVQRHTAPRAPGREAVPRVIRAVEDLRNSGGREDRYDLRADATGDRRDSEEDLGDSAGHRETYGLQADTAGDRRDSEEDLEDAAGHKGKYGLQADTAGDRRDSEEDLEDAAGHKGKYGLQADTAGDRRDSEEDLGSSDSGGSEDEDDLQADPAGGRRASGRAAAKVRLPRKPASRAAKRKRFDALLDDDDDGSDDEDDDEPNTGPHGKPAPRGNPEPSLRDAGPVRAAATNAITGLYDRWRPEAGEDAFFESDAGHTHNARYWEAPERGPARELLGAYARFHRETVRKGGKVDAVVVRPIGQLCNRLMTIATGFVLALVTRRVLVVDDAGFYCSMNDLFDKPGFDWLQQQLPAGVSLRADAVVRNPNRPPWSETEKLLCKNLSGAYPAGITLNMNQYMVPYVLQNPKYKEALRDIFPGLDLFTPIARFLFRPVAAIRSARDAFIREHFTPGRHVVGLQVRSGSDFTANFMTASDWALYKSCGLEPDRTSSEPPPGGEAAGTSGKRMRKNNVLFFVATDTEQGREAASQNLGADVTFGPGPFLRSNNPKGVQMALLDVLLLAEADSLVTTAWSSFGYMASGLRGGYNKIVSDYNAAGAVAVAPEREQFFMGVPHKSDKRVICAHPPTHQPCFHKFANWGAREASCFQPDMIAEEMLNGRYC